MATEIRLICLDEAIAKIKDDGILGAGYDDAEREDDVIDMLERCHIVDAVEVVHGRWVIEKRHTVSRNPYMDDNYHAHATCSECDFCIDSSNGSFGFPKLNTTNYCPNFGADMRGNGNG